ncbi:unnamed protein product [Oncorhynchus mykiss]|uniref:Uncharacterized protein n=1 Tax=Oncorhynchus mykiss TaxID=8022 RepID=A0A060XGF2_ONCMY|nr:unnamed protein product [Oncorhynchus mykiss]
MLSHLELLKVILDNTNLAYRVADVEDNSQTESISRASKSAADDSWPSSDEEDELDITQKKHPKLNLKNLMNASKKGKNDAVTDVEKPWSGPEAKRESENQVQRNPSLPKAFPPSSAPQHLVSPSPSASFTSKPAQMISTCLQSSRKEKDSTEDEEDYDEDRGGDEEDEEEKSFEEMGKTKYQTEEEKDDSLVDDSPVPGSQDTSKEKQRDFLSELGLEKGDDEEDSWDTESGSVSPRKHHGRDPAKVPHVSIISGENKEVLRNYDNDADNDNVPEKPEKIKRETLSILTKLELSKKDADKKTDIMEELGLGDVDDLEDASDWDTASTSSRRTLPGHGVPSPGGEELREEASSRSPVPLPAVQEQEPDALIAERSGPEEKRHFLSERPLPLASPRSLTPQTQPQPCARKMLLQRTESEEDFNWDSNHVNTSTPSPVRTGKQLPNVTETVAVLKPNNPLREPSPVKQESESSPEPEEQAQEVGVLVRENLLQLTSSHPSAKSLHIPCFKIYLTFLLYHL